MVHCTVRPIWALLFLSLAIPANGFPVFVGLRNYLLLILRDPLLLRALFNTLFFPFTLALTMGELLYFLKAEWAKKPFTKRDYFVLFVASAAIVGIITSLRTAYEGFPLEEYSLQTITTHITAMHLPFLLLYMEVGLLVCFLRAALD